MTKAALLLAAGCLCALTAGCGGGGGGGGGGPTPPAPAPPPPPPLRPQDYANHAEYKAAWGLGAVNAAMAYARIARRDGAGTAPGKGARVAVVDVGVDKSHWEFNQFGSRLVESCFGDCGDRTHGTAVASVIAARRSPNGPPPGLAQNNFHGVAWGIDRLESLSLYLGGGGGGGDGKYRGLPFSQVGGQLNWLASRFSALETPDFVNMSFGVSGLVENYRGIDFGSAYPIYNTAVRTLAQPGAASKAVLVISAGNNHDYSCNIGEPNCVPCDVGEPNCDVGKIDATSPALFAGLPVLEASLRSHVVAVAATDDQGRIASFSNRCGIAAKWCIAAPGVRILAADYNPSGPQRGYAYWGGTSLAAPYVTGGLAVMKHWFRSQLKNEELLERLYLTARVTPDAVSDHGGTCPAHLDTDGDRSACELSSVFGRGLMDLGAATAPVGGLSLALGHRVSGRAGAAGSSRMQAGRALGDALGRSLAGRRIALFDTLGGPFWADAAGFAEAAPAPGPALRLSRWFADMAEEAPEASGQDGRLRFRMDAPEGAHMGIAARPASAEAQFGDLALSAFASTDSAGADGARTAGAGVFGLALAWRPAGGPVSFGAGRMEEAETLLGARAEGAFGGLSSSLDFVGAEAGFEAGGWRFDMAAELGRALPEAEGGLLADGGRAAFSTAFSAAAARRLGAGALRLSLQQPLRVESGRLDLSLPVGRTPEGAVRRERVPVGLEPSGRQIDFGIDWTEPLAPGAAWRIGAVLSRDPGHEAGRGAEAVLLAGLRIGL